MTETILSMGDKRRIMDDNVLPYEPQIVSAMNAVEKEVLQLCKARALQGAAQPNEGEPFEELGAKIEWEYRDDHMYPPREFWHARVEFRDFSGEWNRYGEQEKRELPAVTKAAAEAELRKQFNETFKDLMLWRGHEGD